jgi:hypothetical protein
MADMSITRRDLLRTAVAAAPDLRSVAPDLHVPPLRNLTPAPGRRVRVEREGSLYHVLYLPTDWRPGRRYPVIVEYAGNGGYRNAFGDESLGTPEGSKLGYGLSGGRGFIWICLPYVDPGRKIATQWWGDPDLTTAYCRRELGRLCDQHGADPRRIILAGFSRGAIAVSYLGLRDEETSRWWRGFFAYSHFDGVRDWPYGDSTRAAALQRLRRLRGRPVFVCHEQSVQPTRAFLTESRVPGRFTFQPIRFRNHNDAWVLRDVAERRAARKWLRRIT